MYEELSDEELLSEYIQIDTKIKNECWDIFCRYNIQDVLLVQKIDAKLNLLQIAIKMSYIAKVNYIDCLSPVKSWESYINNYLLGSRIIPPLLNPHAGAVEFPGAWVKIPKQGIQEWTMTVDASSLYPSIICQLNLSPETFVGMHEEYTCVQKFVDKEYDLDELKLNNYSIGANGAMFNKNKVGFLPILMTTLLEDRAKYKKRMIELKKQLNDENNVDITKLKNDIATYSNFEQALKLFLNSAFGSIGNSYFKFFDIRLASAITSTGQYALKHGERYMNNYFNDLFNTGDRDFIIYGDTDSIFFDMSEFINKFKPIGTVQEKVDFIDSVCENKISKVLDKCYTELFEYTNGKVHKLFYKREAISSKCFFIARKKYAMLVENNEGVSYDPYYLKVMGLEIVRSSTPECVRDSLKKCVELVLTSDNDTIIQYISDIKADFMKRPIHEISFPKGINNIKKYDMESGMFRSGCPIQVRAAINHNRQVNRLKIRNIYPLIVDGDKIKFCYLRTPNPLHQNVIGFMDEFPEEFAVEKYVDYNLQFEKTFLCPLESILTSIGWVTERKANLFSFFGGGA